MIIEVVFLGTGAGAPGRDRGLPAILIQDEKGRIILLDAGEGTQYRLMSLGMSPLNITHILISHLHGDHIFGLPGLLASMVLLGRKSDLTIYGPPGIYEFLDTTFRVIGNPPFRVIIHELEEANSVRRLQIDDDLILEYVTARHSVINHAYALIWKTRVGRFNPEKAKALGIPIRLWRRLHMGETVVLEDGRIVRPEDVIDVVKKGLLKLVYTGDTAPCEPLIEISKEADLLIHEATFSAREDKDVVWAQGHSRSIDAARTALEANAKFLVLTHISNRYANPDLLAREASREFRRVIAARDFLTICIKE